MRAGGRLKYEAISNYGVIRANLSGSVIISYNFMMS